MKDLMENKVSPEIREKISEIASAMSVEEARVFASVIPWEILIDEIRERHERVFSKLNSIEKIIENK